MTTLWLAVMALLLLALALVVPALLRAGGPVDDGHEDLLRRVYRDQFAELDSDARRAALDPAQQAQAVDELQRGLLDDAARRGPPRAAPWRAAWTGWPVAGALAVALPVAAIALYSRLGNPHAAAAQLLAGGQAPAHAGAGDDPETMVTRLAARLRSEPGDLVGWVMLARSYEVLGRFDDAVLAYEKAKALAPDEPGLHAAYADAWASAHEGDLGGPARAAITTALALDADHPKALALAGMAAFREGDHALARRHWERLQRLLEPGSEAAAQTAANLALLPPAASASATPK